MKYRFSMEIETLDDAHIKPHEFEDAIFFALKLYCKKTKQTLILNDKSLEDCHSSSIGDTAKHREEARHD